MTSLLPPHFDVSMRPTNDKEIEVVDLDQLFDQYVETDLLQQFSDSTAEPSGSDDLAHLFELPSSNGDDAFETSSMPNWDPTSEDAWHKALQKLEQNPALPSRPDNSFSIYPESRGKASLSDPELLSFDDLFELDFVDPRSRSQPSTPQPQVARPAKKARSSPDRTTRHGVHKTPKKSAFSNFATKMMRPSQYRAGFQDLWARKMDTSTEAFNLQIPPSGIHSPPPSTKLMQDEHSSGFFHRDHQPYTIAMSPLTGEDTTTPDMSHSNYQLTPLSSPTIDTNSRSNSNGDPFQFSNDNMASAYISHHISNAALSALQTPPPSHRLHMGPWGSDTSPNLDFSSFSASPDFSHSGGKTAGWWNNNGSSSSIPVTQAQPSTPSSYHHSHSRSASQNMGFGSSTGNVAGLGISCDTSSFSGFGSELMGNTANGIPNSASFDMSGYHTVYPPTPQHHGIPIGQPRHSPSRSPSLSPQPRFTRRRHSAHQSHHRSSTSRRKSSGGSNQTHARSNSASVGFVNFTPDDSRKILTGVAPSGSSKTKARREKEAAEKRRKLSQAAVKAVIEAGGDIGRLEKEGLLALEG